MSSPVVVLGATGQVGLFAVAGLLKAGREVIAVTRNRAGAGGTRLGNLSRCDLAQLGALLRTRPESGGAALLSCGPAALALAALECAPPANHHHWERLLVIGSTSTIVKRSSPDAAEREVIGEIESALREIRERCASDGIPLTVLSPTLIYGCGKDENLSRVWRWIRRIGIAPLAARHRGMRQPLHVADLAATIVNALQARPAPELETPVSGGSALEYGEMIGRLFDAAGLRRRCLRLPSLSFPLVAGLSRLLPAVTPISSEMFRRQSRDLVFDDSQARTHLGHEPRDFHPTAEDFDLPAHIDRIRAALI